MEIDYEENNNKTDGQAEAEILKLLKAHPEGVPQSQIFTQQNFSDMEIIDALNNLFEFNKIVAEGTQDNKIFKILNEREQIKLRDLSGEELRVYDLIVSSGSNGITTNELRIQSGMSSNLLTKIKKRLEKKLLIKSLTIANMKNKKVLLAYEVEPNTELTGGFWCTDQQFDKNLIEVISAKCLDYLHKQKSATRKEILIYIKSTGLVQNDMKEEDLQKVLNILIMDEKIDLVKSRNEIFLENTSSNQYSMLLKKNDNMLNQLRYKTSGIYTPPNILNSIPCTFCPVIKECQIDNVINPKECPHLIDFLNLF